MRARATAARFLTALHDVAALLLCCSLGAVRRMVRKTAELDNAIKTVAGAVGVKK
jgi:hypothetical protein